MAEIYKKQIIDSRIMAPASKTYPVFKGSSSNIIAEYPAIAPSLSQITYTAVLPDNTFISPDIKQGIDMIMAYQITFARDVPAGPGPAGPDDLSVAMADPILPLGGGLAQGMQGPSAGAPTAYPFTSMLSSIETFINSQPLQTFSMNNVAPLMFRLVNNRKAWLQTFPANLDNVRNLEDMSLAVGDIYADFSNSVSYLYAPNGSHACIRFCDANGNVFNNATTQYVDALGSTVLVRNGYPVCGRLVGGNATPFQNTNSCVVYIRYTATEPIFCSPSMWQFDPDTKEHGMFNINMLQFKLNFDSTKLNYLFKIDDTVSTSIANTTLALRQYMQPYQSGFRFMDARMILNQLNPNLSIGIPENVCVTPHFYTEKSVTETTIVLGAGESRQGLITQQITLGQVPELQAFYARPSYYGRQSGLAAAPAVIKQPNQGDYYYRIDRLSIDGYFGQANIMSSFRPEQLYEVSCSNGLQMDFNLWRGSAVCGGQIIPTIGSIVLLRPSKDFYLAVPELAPGLQVPCQFVAKFDITNVGAAEEAGKVVHLYCVSFFSDYVVTESGKMMTRPPPLSREDVLRKLDNTNEPLYDSVVSGLVRGGGFFSNLGSKLGSTLSKVSNIYSRGKEMYKKAAPIVSLAKDFLPQAKKEEKQIEEMTEGKGRMTASGRKAHSRSSYM